MGIQGLLPLLKSIHKPSHLRNFAGQTLGVDAYGWLHRGTVACAIELAQGKPTRKHIDFAIGRVRMLIHFGVKPYLVFDGNYLPSKSHTEKDRAKRRKESKRLGLELLKTGRTSMAQLELQKAVDVTPLMARELIEELKRLDVPYIVAPYEADSQLAYLEKKGIISGVVSEDSDLLVFGVNRLLTKLDQYGECIMIRREDFTACQDISLVGWSDKEFRTMAMLSGCDYLPGIERMGLKTAYRMVRKHKDVAKVVRTIQFEGKMKISPDYLEAFTRAERTFLYQWVFCPVIQEVVNLNSLPRDLEVDSLPYLGKPDEARIAIGVASGELDPNTKEKLILLNRPTTFGSRVLRTPDSKPGKPITEFFRSKRTPLAELDPNSFTPSPSQQQLLTSQQNVTWSAREFDGSRNSRARTSQRGTAPSSAPQPPRRAVSDLWTSMRGNMDSAKRQRLCSDAFGPVTSSKESSSPSRRTSRFFSSVVSETPSKGKAESAKGSDEFELWSDDTFAQAEALEAASQATSDNAEIFITKKQKKLEIFTDTVDESKIDEHDSDHGTEENSSTATSMTQQTSNLSASTQGGSSFYTEATSLSSQSSTIGSDLFSQRVDANFAAFKARFAFTADTSRRQSTPVLGTTECLALSCEQPQIKPNTDQAPPIFVGKNAAAALPKPAKVPDILPSPQPTMIGSEDLLVPQSSPLRSEEDVEEESEKRVSPPLNLLKFTFTT